MIPGNGPRKDICARCGVELGLIDATEASQFLDADLAKARTTALSQRLIPWVWLGMIWMFQLTLFVRVSWLSKVGFVVAILSTIVVPILEWIRLPRHRATMSSLTPSWPS